MSTASPSGFDAQHYDLKIELDPSRGHLNGNARVLFRATADLQERECGFSSLMLASQNGHTEVVQMLLQANANVDLKNNYGYTSLMRVSANGHPEVVKMLLQANANTEIVSEDRYIKKLFND